LQERLALGNEWETTLEGIGFNLRDPAILAELSKRGTLIKGEVSATMLQDLRDMLATQFYREGQSPAALAKDIQRIFPMTYWGRAQTIARTETGFAQQAVQHEAFKRDGVPEKQWHASFRNTRDTHARAHGQVQKTEEPFLVGGVYMMHPHAAGAPAGEVVNCNCEIFVVYPEDAVGIPASPWLGGPEGEAVRVPVAAKTAGLPTWKPTMNSADAEEFVKGSKVTQNVYHGTSEKASALIKEEGFLPSSEGVYGKGVYLTDDQKLATDFAHGQGSPVLAGKVRLENPWVGTGSEYQWFVEMELGPEVKLIPESMGSLTERKLLAVKARGYDGIVVDIGNDRKYIVAFEKEQVVVVQ
jgi:SPP1 gp7 family putative phage head morphogenesis protein